MGGSKCLDSTVVASEPKPLVLAQLQPPEGGPSRAKGAQAEPEQSPAGKQWEGPGQRAGNSQAWGGRVGRGPAQGPMTSGDALSFCLNFPSYGVTTALLALHRGKQEVLPIIPPKECMLGPTPRPNSASSLGFWLPVQFDQSPPLLTHPP